MPDILFVSSKNTGYGHQSIVEALTEQIKIQAPELKVEISDAFLMGGKVTTFMSKLYNFVVVKFPVLWGISYKFADVFPEVIRFFSLASLKKGFRQLLAKGVPRLIIVLHPAYVSAVHEVLRESGLTIPVLVYVADFDNVTSLWADKRTKYTLCPTENAREKMLKRGISPEKTKIFSFPARDRFNHCNPPDGNILADGIIKKDKLTFLLLNGSQGSGYFIKIAGTLLDNFNCDIIIIAGRNEKLKNRLERILQSKYKERINILGFVNDVEKYMSVSDMVITRASPNVLTEAVNLCKPVIVTGAFTGQEARNPHFVLEHRLGVVCTHIDKLPQCIKDLLEGDGKKLKDIFNGQLSYRNTSSAHDISKFIIESLYSQDRLISKEGNKYEMGYIENF